VGDRIVLRRLGVGSDRRENDNLAIVLDIVEDE
jgi:hypothetical protein